MIDISSIILSFEVPKNKRVENKNEFNLLELILENPDCEQIQYEEKLKVNSGQTVLSIEDYLKKWWLDTRNKRHGFSKRIEKLAYSFYKVCFCEKFYYSDFMLIQNFLEINTTNCRYKAILIKTLGSLNNSYVHYNKFYDLVKFLSFRQCHDFMEKCIKKVNEDNKHLLNIFSLLEVKKENEDLFNAYSFLENENKQLKNELVRKEESLKKKVILELFRKMNKETNILDNFSKVAENYKNINCKYENDVEIKSIITTVRSFLKFIDKIGIKSVLESYRNLDINFDDFNRLNLYFKDNAEFIDSKKPKSIQIETLGWKYDEEFISKPACKEVLVTEGEDE